MAGANVLLGDEEELRIVLLGKSGVGKSAVRNTLLGRNAFKSRPCLHSVTTECQREEGLFDGRKLAVIDTPGLFYTSKTSEEVVRDIVKCISMAAPGPHVFVIVLQLGRFTKEDQDIVEIIQIIFGEKSLKYTMVVFTHGDDLDDRDFIEEVIKHNEALGNFIRKCWGGYHVLNNKDRNPKQVCELLDKISNMIKNYGGSYYTNEMFKEAEKAKKEEMQQRLSENPNMESAGTERKQDCIIQ